MGCAGSGKNAKRPDPSAVTLVTAKLGHRREHRTSSSDPLRKTTMGHVSRCTPGRPWACHSAVCPAPRLFPGPGTKHPQQTPREFQKLEGCETLVGSSPQSQGSPMPQALTVPGTQRNPLSVPGAGRARGDRGQTVDGDLLELEEDAESTAWRKIPREGNQCNDRRWSKTQRPV